MHITLIGYARVSTDDQYLDLQRDALTLVGCERIYEDTVSGAQAEREGLARLINALFYDLVQDKAVQIPKQRNGASVNCRSW